MLRGVRRQGHRLITPGEGLRLDAEPDELGFDAVRLGRVDSMLAAYVDDGLLPGWSLAIARHGRVAHLSRHGLRDVAAARPIEFDTVFRIFSMTKPAVSLAALMLYEQGRFELGDPLARFLPEFADMRVFTGGSDLRPTTVPATEPIRVWHLLTHTAGLTYGFHRAHPVDAMYRAAGFEWAAPPGVDLAAAVQRLATMPLLFQPGAEWNYSVATDVLGRLVEVLTGTPLDEALRTMIFEPLGMTETSFGVPDERRDRLATLYTPRPGGGGMVPNSGLARAVDEPTWLSGGGGLTSTLGDYHRFAQLLRGRGEFDGVRLLGPRTHAAMTANQLPGGVDLHAFGRPLFAETPFTGVGFGLGVSVTVDPIATRTLGSVGEYGWGGAASTAFWVDPVEDLTVVFMTQLLPSSTYPLRSRLRQLVYSALVD